MTKHIGLVASVELFSSLFCFRQLSLVDAVLQVILAASLISRFHSAAVTAVRHKLNLRATQDHRVRSPFLRRQAAVTSINKALSCDQQQKPVFALAGVSRAATAHRESSTVGHL
jgi:hypothetical protein